MTFKSDLSGLKKLADNAKKLDGTHSVRLLDLFNPKFMAARTKSKDFVSFCELAGFKVETDEDFKAIPDDAWEAHVKANSEFAGWAEMQQVAGAEYMKDQLFKGIK
jgi:hypothetical protein